MTQINLSDLLLYSGISGFGNDNTDSFSYTIPSATISVSETWVNSTALTIANSLSQIEVQLQKYGTNPINDPNWYTFKGFMGNFYKPVVANLDYEWTNNLADAYMEVDILTSYTANTLVFTTTVYNMKLSGDLTFPGLTVEAKYSLFSAPF